MGVTPHALGSVGKCEGMNPHTSKGTCTLGVRILVVRISGLPFGSLGIKCHLDVGFIDRHKIYYKGEGGGSPKVQAMVSLVSSNLLVARPNTKSAPTTH